MAVSTRIGFELNLSSLLATTGLKRSSVTPHNGPSSCQCCRLVCTASGASAASSTTTMATTNGTPRRFSICTAATMRTSTTCGHSATVQISHLASRCSHRRTLRRYRTLSQGAFLVEAYTEHAIYKGVHYSALADTDIQLTCVDCVFKSNFSVGVDFDVTLGNASCTVTPDESCFTLTKANMNFTVLEFEQTANLEVFLGQQFSKELNFS